MGWIVEAVIELLWDEWIYATYKRHGLAWAIAATVLPVVVVAALVVLAILLLRTS